MKRRHLRFVFHSQQCQEHFLSSKAGVRATPPLAQEGFVGSPIFGALDLPQTRTLYAALLQVRALLLPSPKNPERAQHTGVMLQFIDDLIDHSAGGEPIGF